MQLTGYLLYYNIVLLLTLFEGLCSKQRVFKLVVAFQPLARQGIKKGLRFQNS